jgi:hypothetical protein
MNKKIIKSVDDSDGCQWLVPVMDFSDWMAIVYASDGYQWWMPGINVSNGYYWWIVIVYASGWD